MTPVEIPGSPPEALSGPFSRSTLLLAAVRAFREIERDLAQGQSEDVLLAEYSELVVVPSLVTGA